MNPFHFGTSHKSLFGVYHLPQAGPERDCGIVLCYPMGYEYIRAHRAFRQLAIHLTNAGFHVLRFDYYGCGDSSGDSEQGEIRQWRTDISTAIGTIRAKCGSLKVCLVGLRLGGTLSMMVGAERDDITSMVLWDPIVNGRAYIQELTTWHRAMLPYSHAQPKSGTRGEKPLTILGFPFTDALLRGLENIDLLAIQQKPAPNILLIESNAEAGQGGFRAHLQSMSARVQYQHLPSPPIWMEDPRQALVPHQTLQSIVVWISKEFP
jgi:pimeloyl-ACP methyl ester carboxylesterase